MAADYRHINRLLEIYTLIQGSGGGWTAKKLAEKFKTTTRTIFRDIDVLKSVGIPVNHDPDQKCYAIRHCAERFPQRLQFRPEFHQLLPQRTFPQFRRRDRLLDDATGFQLRLKSRIIWKGVV